MAVTRVDFYVLKTDSVDSRLRTACRIAQKAVQHRQHVYINTADKTDADKLDGLLWTFSQGSFIPHIVAGRGQTTDGDEPVVIGTDESQSAEVPSGGPGEHWDVMINLASAVPPYFSRYARVAEVVDADPARRDEGRQRYRFYKDRGYELNTHQI